MKSKYVPVELAADRTSLMIDPAGTVVEPLMEGVCIVVVAVQAVLDVKAFDEVEFLFDPHVILNVAVLPATLSLIQSICFSVNPVSVYIIT